MNGPMPMTIDDLSRPPEPEPGREIHFCPVLGLPIVPELRVRAHPGLHLLSLDAGKEALARGFYQAFGEKFPCCNLEYLHPDDKVFICAEDNKTFLNEMSMRYHRYIGHELMVRKAERKRLRDRAEERKVRNASHRQAIAPSNAPKKQPSQTGAFTEAPPQEKSSSPAGVSPGLPVIKDPYGGGELAEESVHVPSQMSVQAHLPAAIPAQKVAPATVAAVTPSPVGNSPSVADAVQIPKKLAPGSVASDVASPPCDDLYGDMGGETKPATRGSDYATAIGAIFGGDSDDED